MGQYVHLSMIMPCNSNDPVAVIAKKHLDLFEHGNDELIAKEAIPFLTDLSERSGINHGPKGGLLLWGMVGNYTSGELFVECLKPFWRDLYHIDETIPAPACLLGFEHIIVFVEVEQQEQATAYEISYDRDSDSVSFKTHLCPFAWTQY